MTPQLLLSKRLFIEAAAYAEKTDAVSAGIAISLLQDSAELCVWTLLKKHNISVKDKDGFVINLESLKKASLAIPDEAKLLELNTARIGFKHYGNLPAPTEVRKHQSYVEDFLRRTMREHFNISFDELSLVDLIGDKTIRNSLHAAENHVAIAQYAEAAGELARARTMAFGKMQKYLPTVPYNLRNIDELLNKIPGIHGRNAFTHLSDYLSVLRETILVAIYRLPIEDYAFLRNNLPSAQQSADGCWYVSDMRGKYTEEDCRKALSCIVNLCQRLDNSA